MKIAFITNALPHYRIKTFEKLAQHYDIEYLFFSPNHSRFGPDSHEKDPGNFSYSYFSSTHLIFLSLPLTMIWYLLNHSYDTYIKCINDPVALTVVYLIAKIKRKPFILWTGVWMNIDTPVHKIIRFWIHYIYRNSDAIVVYGKHVETFLVNQGVSPTKIFVAPHSIDNDAYNQDVNLEEIVDLRKRLCLGEDQKMILYLGRLIECKGLSYLLEGFKQANQDDAILVVAGTGPEKQALENLAFAEGIHDRVRFPGYVDAEMAYMYYASADVFVLPSITTKSMKETWGLVVNEAFNQGLPVIASNAVGAAAGGFVIDSYNGFVVPERNSHSIAVKLTELLSNQELRTTMGKHAEETVGSWNNDKMVSGFCEAINFVSTK